MGIPKTIGKHILFPMYNIVKRSDIGKTFKQLLANEKLNKKELEKLQLRKLKHIITHAYRTVPYYRELMDEKGLTPKDFTRLTDIRKLPILDKQTITNNTKRLISRPYRHKKLIHNPTGGSTGKPTDIYSDVEKFNKIKATRMRYESWAGIDINDKQVLLWGSPNETTLNKTLKGRTKNFMMNRLFLDCFDMTEEHMHNYVERINKFRPKAITTFTNAIYTLAKFIKKNRLEVWSPDAIFLTAELLDRHQRILIEKVFHAKTYNLYGCREVGDIAQECSSQNMHINADNMLIEFVKDGKWTRPGHAGEILITDFNSLAMPLIRYRVGDVGTPLVKRCPCGRTLPLMDMSKGRVFGMFVTPDGKLVHGGAFNEIFWGLKGTEKFQIVQEKKNLIVVKLLREKGQGDIEKEALDAVVKKIQNKMGDSVNVKFEFPKKLENEKSGKFMWAKSKVNVQF